MKNNKYGSNRYAVESMKELNSAVRDFKELGFKIIASEKTSKTMAKDGYTITIFKI